MTMCLVCLFMAVTVCVVYCRQLKIYHSKHWGSSSIEPVITAESSAYQTWPDVMKMILISVLSTDFPVPICGQINCPSPVVTKYSYSSTVLKYDLEVLLLKLTMFILYCSFTKFCCKNFIF